ncbi:helix-turn-helix transcriptional regulator [Candidatus Daviesbacteria bacterium]|nr:helix-turn-helix transcriptional regulator [Candidatus Daviesbacteria bacterium]
MTKYKKLGEKVKKLRKARDWTQEKLAEAANVDPKTIIELEAGKRANPTLQTLNKLARALKTSLEELLST